MVFLVLPCATVTLIFNYRTFFRVIYPLETHTLRSEATNLPIKHISVALLFVSCGRSDRSSKDAPARKPRPFQGRLLKKKSLGAVSRTQTPAPAPNPPSAGLKFQPCSGSRSGAGPGQKMTLACKFWAMALRGIPLCGCHTALGQTANTFM